MYSSLNELFFEKKLIIAYFIDKSGWFKKPKPNNQSYLSLGSCCVPGNCYIYIECIIVSNKVINMLKESRSVEESHIIDAASVASVSSKKY